VADLRTDVESMSPGVDDAGVETDLEGPCSVTIPMGERRVPVRRVAKPPTASNGNGRSLRQQHDRWEAEGQSPRSGISAPDHDESRSDNSSAPTIESRTPITINSAVAKKKSTHATSAAVPLPSTATKKQISGTSDQASAERHVRNLELTGMSLAIDA
jgi:hypothetical protein